MWVLNNEMFADSYQQPNCTGVHQRLMPNVDTWFLRCQLGNDTCQQEIFPHYRRPVADEVTLLMKDYEAAEVLEILDTNGPELRMKPEPLLFPITKLEPEEIKDETDLCFSDETDLEEEFSSMQAEEVGIKSRKKKDRPKIQQVEFCLD